MAPSVSAFPGKSAQFARPNEPNISPPLGPSGPGFSCICAACAVRARAASPVAAVARSERVADAPPESRCHADLELDPSAYLLDGFSLHVGLGWNAMRVDLGVFGLHVPEFVHRQPEFDVAFDGYGLKWQYFPFAEQRGGFIGFDAAYARSRVRLQGTQLTARDNQFALGVNAGVRVELVGGLYVTPWLGIGYAFGAEDLSLADHTFSANPWLIFPAVHLGYRLR